SGSPRKYPGHPVGLPPALSHQAVRVSGDRQQSSWFTNSQPSGSVGGSVPESARCVAACGEKLGKKGTRNKRPARVGFSLIAVTDTFRSRGRARGLSALAPGPPA